MQDQQSSSIITTPKKKYNSALEEFQRLSGKIFHGMWYPLKRLKGYPFEIFDCNPINNWATLASVPIVSNMLLYKATLNKKYVMQQYTFSVKVEKTKMSNELLSRFVYLALTRCALKAIIVVTFRESTIMYCVVKGTDFDMFDIPNQGGITYRTYSFSIKYFKICDNIKTLNGIQVPPHRPPRYVKFNHKKLSIEERSNISYLYRKDMYLVLMQFKKGLLEVYDPNDCAEKKKWRSIIWWIDRLDPPNRYLLMSYL